MDDSARYAALQRHDTRFDGRFFVGVSSTGIYCRPVCRAKVPKQSNCRFFPSAAGAEAEGYRPCLRCRPELAPGVAGVDRASRIARTMADLIDDGVAADGRLRGFAARLGISDRDLQCAFVDAFGVTPHAYAQTQRLLLAKRLLSETELPLTRVALAAGFSSVRGFKTAFTGRYALEPRAIRRTRSAHRQSLSFILAYRPPYAWTALLAFLERRAITGVEAVSGTTYRRTMPARLAANGWIEVSHDARRQRLDVRLAPALADSVAAVLGRVKRAFDLNCTPQDIARALGSLADGAPGLRVPGGVDGFEIAVRAILGQQVSVAAARTMAGRFAKRFGAPAATPWPELATTFPPAGAIAAARAADMRALGIVTARCRAIKALAIAIVDGAVDLERAVDIQAQVTALEALPGIGAWTAQYIAMRALRWPDAFPHTDLGVRKALGDATPRQVLRHAESWRPWRAYAVMHLWRSLAEQA